MSSKRWGIWSSETYSDRWVSKSEATKHFFNPSNTMNFIVKNIKLIITHPWFVSLWIIISGLMIWGIRSTTDRGLVSWNYGDTYRSWIQTLDITNSVLFGGFVSAFAYKWYLFRDQSKTSYSWRGGGIFSVLVTGCPACSITLASYLWLAWLLSALPYGGIEIKIFSTIILLRSLGYQLKHLTVCSIKK